MELQQMFWLGGFNGAGCYVHHAGAFSVQRVRKTFVSFVLLACLKATA